MRKKLTILAVILGVIAVYSGFWFMQGQRFKESIAIILNDAATELHQLDMEFIYGDLRLSGFPFSHQVYVHQPRFVGDDARFPFDLSSHLPLVVKMSLLGTVFDIQLPRHMEMFKRDVKQEEAYQLLFFTQPNLEIALDYDANLSRLVSFWTGQGQENSDFFLKNASIDHVLFESEALSVMAVGDGEKILGFKQFYVDYDETKIADDLIAADVKWLVSGLKSELFLNVVPQNTKPFGSLQSAGALRFQLPVSADIMAENEYVTQWHVENASLKTPHFAVYLKGDLEMGTEKAISEELLTLKVDHYQKAVEYLVAFYYAYLADEGEKRRYLSDKVRIKRAIEILASEISADETSLIVRVEPSMEGEEGVINIGNYTMPEAQKVWQTGYGIKRKRIEPAAPIEPLETESLSSDEDASDILDAEPSESEITPPPKAIVPSSEIKKQLKPDEEEDDTLYEYPDTTGRRR